MDWKIGLDRYLTTPPDDGFDNWCEDVCDRITNIFYDENEKWINDGSGQCNKWLNELFRRGKDATEAAKMIERAFRFYCRK